MPEAERYEDPCGRIRAGERVRDDVVDLAARHSALHQSASSSSTEPLPPELRGDLVTDLDGALDRRAGETTRAEQAPCRVVDEELHGPHAVGLRRGPKMLQGEADGLRELGPAVWDG